MSERRPFVELPRSLAPLGYRNFGLYWIGHAASHSGKWIELTGAVWLVFELTGSPLLLGLLGVFRGVPAILLAPIGGAVADRVDQRRLLFATQALGLVASLCLGVLVAMGLVQFWHVYVQVAMQAAITAFDGAVRQALFPRLVPRARRAEAVTLDSTAGRTSALIGPAVGGLAIASLGVASPFLLNAGTFLVLMAAVALMRGVVPRTARAGSSFRSELMEGLRYLMEAPVLSGLLKLEIAFSVFNMNAVMITIVGRQVLDVGPEGLGGLLSAPGLGSLIGIACLLILGQTRQQGRLIVLCTFAYAAALVAFAASRDYAISFAALLVAGLFDVLVTVTRKSVMQLTAPGRMRGRVIGNMRIVTGGLTPLAQTQSGILAGAIGAPLAVVSAAAALAIAAGVTARANPALWGFSSDEGREPAGRPAESPSESPVT